MVKAGAPSAGLYLKCALADFEDLMSKLRQVFFVINRSEYEKNMHIVEIDPGGAADLARLQEFVAFVQAQSTQSKS